ncbi:MAG: hypothetical protein QME07_03010 [bacterium]|nr:hypothetical protein [bacterium]
MVEIIESSRKDRATCPNCKRLENAIIRLSARLEQQEKVIKEQEKTIKQLERGLAKYENAHTPLSCLKEFKETKFCPKRS